MKRAALDKALGDSVHAVGDVATFDWWVSGPLAARTAGRILLALFLISTLVLVAARSIAPDVNALHVLFYVAAGTICCFVLISLCIVIGGAFNQWALNRGATDAQWFIFPRSQQPPGLQSLQGQAASQPAGDHEIADAVATPAPRSDEIPRL